VVAQRELAERLERAISELPEDYRAVVTLRHVEGLSYEEIADALRCPLGTVKVRLFRARQRLRERMRPMLGPECGK
jgi:RNA polymerase sigma-70 factor (ECF subfamily)